MGAKYRKQYPGAVERASARTASFQNRLRRRHDTSERDIIWATTAKKSSRSYHVRNLYPRLLYTFSDVTVFVMKNARVIEDVIEQLINWADAVQEACSNQPVLPHAIIVLNASENQDSSLWSVNHSTSALLYSLRNAVRQNPKL